MNARARVCRVCMHAWALPACIRVHTNHLASRAFGIEEREQSGYAAFIAECRRHYIHLGTLDSAFLFHHTHTHTHTHTPHTTHTTHTTHTHTHTHTSNELQPGVLTRFLVFVQVIQKTLRRSPSGPRHQVRQGRPETVPSSQHAELSLRARTPCSSMSARGTRANSSTSAMSVVRRPRASVFTQRTSSCTPTHAHGRPLPPSLHVDEMKRITEQLIQVKAALCKVAHQVVSRDRTNDARVSTEVLTCAGYERLWPGRLEQWCTTACVCERESVCVCLSVCLSACLYVCLWRGRIALN